jgi:hypothetical protein
MSAKQRKPLSKDSAEIPRSVLNPCRFTNIWWSWIRQQARQVTISSTSPSRIAFSEGCGIRRATEHCRQLSDQPVQNDSKFPSDGNLGFTQPGSVFRSALRPNQITFSHSQDPKRPFQRWKIDGRF